VGSWSRHSFPLVALAATPRSSVISNSPKSSRYIAPVFKVLPTKGECKKRSSHFRWTRRSGYDMGHFGRKDVVICQATEGGACCESTSGHFDRYHGQYHE